MADGDGSPPLAKTLRIKSMECVGIPIGHLQQPSASQFLAYILRSKERHYTPVPLDFAPYWVACLYGSSLGLVEMLSARPLAVVVKKEVTKLLAAGIIYPISDSQ
ncbi:hypothetical protein CR513_48533, partial [Mucuna pruriens]